MSGTVTISEAPTTGIGKLLTENRFFVPTHQRDYRWNEDRVKKLWDDLTEAIERKDKFYFIGLMVFMRELDEKLRVLDGQQRLATTIIIFSAIRAWFGTVEAVAGNRNEATDIQRDFIGRSDYGESDVQPKLALNLNNNDRFQRYVVRGSPLSEVKKERATLSKNAPNFDLLNAIVYCHERVAEIATKAADENAAKEYLTTLIKFLRDSVVVVRLTVPSQSNAFRVFETLNDRGLDLSAVDLIKNYLFGLAHDTSPNMLQQVEHRWSQLTHELTDVKEADFLKVYWTSRYGRTQLDDIFDAVRAEINTGSLAEELTVDLLEASEHFVALDSPDDAVWSPYSPKTRDRIRALALLDSKQVRPVIVAAIKRFSVVEFERLLWLLEVVTVRWQLIGGKRTGAIEINCANLAERIWKRAVTTAAEARKALDSIYTSDLDFAAAFKTKEGLPNNKATYILKRIEIEERQRVFKSEAKELSPDQYLTLEHILPKSPGDEWSKETNDDENLTADCTLRLGNTCMLTEPRNRDAVRKGFDEKKKLYSESSLLITKKVAEYNNWGRDPIEHYQTWLASRAVDVWRYEIAKTEASSEQGQPSLL